MSGRKENFITLRIDDTSLKFMESVCKKYSFTKSKLMRHAVQYYIQYVLSGNPMMNPKMMVSQELFRTIIENLSTEELKDAARVSYEGGIRNNEFDELLAKERNIETEKDKFEIILENMEKYNLSKPGQNWFNSFSHKWEEVNLIITGEHVLGPKFSEFAFYLMEYYGQHFNFTIESHHIDEKKIKIILK